MWCNKRPVIQNRASLQRRDRTGAWSVCVCVCTLGYGSVRNHCILQQQALWYASTFPTAELENPLGKQERELFLSTPSHPSLHPSTTLSVLTLFSSPPGPRLLFSPSTASSKLSKLCFPNSFPIQSGPLSKQWSLVLCAVCESMLCNCVLAASISLSLSWCFPTCAY